MRLTESSYFSRVNVIMPQSSFRFSGSRFFESRFSENQDSEISLLSGESAVWISWVFGYPDYFESIL